MQKGMFQYSFTFEGSYDGPDELPEDFDEYEYVKPLVVKSVRYFGFGNATDVEEYFEW